MLARRRTFDHPGGASVELPLLVPSFSSKGFGLEANTESGLEYSSVWHDLEEFGRHFNRAVLISAYDLHHGHFVVPASAVESGMPLPQPPLAHVVKAELVFLDSGGYELAADFDSSELRRSPHKAKLFTKDDYRAVLESIRSVAPPLPIVIANFDDETKHCPLTKQIREARELFDENPECATTFIIKPGEMSIVDPDNMSDDAIRSLRGFDVIGVTEKELGKDLPDKLRQLMRLRRKLDDARIEAPIHLWGGLDPILTPLFFFAGAEIFDGISWLRYAFQDGVAVNRHSAQILDSRMSVSTGADKAHHFTSIYNLEWMADLEDNLRRWVDDGGHNFDMFDPHVRDRIHAAYRKLGTWDGNAKGAK